MIRILCAPLLLMLVAGPAAAVEGSFGQDTIRTSAGDLVITFIGHASLMMSFGGEVIQIDPWGRMADYSKLPKADLIFITHDHPDHLDTGAIKKIRTDKTVVVLDAKSAEKVEGSIVMKNGDVRTVEGIKVEAVPAYNIVHKRENGQPYHVKGEGNGYILTFGDTRVYIAGDTENTPEMKALKDIDIAFLPMNLPYTMTPEMVADAVRAFKPKVLYPYHYGNTDTSIIVRLLRDDPDTEVRIRKLP